MVDEYNKKVSRYGLLILILAIIALFTPAILYSGIKPVTLSSSTYLAGTISQAIGVQDNGSLLKAGSDYTIENIRYFDEQQWIFVTISYPNVGTAYLVLHNSQGTYTPALGPGTSFSTTYTSGIPSDVIDYMNSKGLLYNASI